MRLHLGSLSGLRSAIADAIRPKAAVGAGFVPGWEALTYGSAYPSATGIEVNPFSSLRCAPVYAAVKVISESFAQIPLFMHERDEKGSLGRVLKHPLAELLTDFPNPEQSMFEFRQQMLVWLLTWGNAYAWIVRDHRGQVAELWAIRPEWVSVTFDPKFPLQPLYTITAPDTTTHQLRRGQIVHFKTFGVQPYKGDSPILLNRETVAGWLVMEQHLSHLFGNGAKPSGVLEAQRALTPEAISNLRREFDATFGGYANSAKTIVLEEGMSWKPVAMTSVESEFQELRKAQLYEVCRIFRIPPLLMQDVEKNGVGSTAETLGRFFVTYTLSPHMEAWEQALSLSLLTRDERRKYYLRHDLTEFTRAESQTRWQAYIAAVTNGILSPNEVRSMEALPPREGGDEYRVPLNLGRTNQYDGQNSHVEDPTPTLVAPKEKAQRALAQAHMASLAELTRHVNHNPKRLRLAAPQPKGSTLQEVKEHAQAVHKN